MARSGAARLPICCQGQPLPDASKEAQGLRRTARSDDDRALGPSLGPILYQLPPRLRINLDRLDEFLTLAPKDVANVFEFREPSWLAEETLALLDRHGASFCVHDMPGSATPRWAAGKAAYLRLHGASGKYHGRYPKKALQSWADWLAEQASAGRECWAYFNNDIDAHAIADALALKALVAEAAD